MKTASNKQDLLPPKWLDRLLAKLTNPVLFEGMLGDLHEIYKDMRLQRGATVASIWYLRQVLGFARYKRLRQPSSHHSTLKSLIPIDMRRDLRLALRYLWKDKFHNALNVIGLLVGIAASTLIFLYVQKEVAYDKHHLKHENIYRVSSTFITSDKPVRFAVSSPALAPIWGEDYPEIISWLRIRTLPQILFKVDDQLFYEEGIVYADSSIFDVFSINFVRGNPRTCLDDENSLILTESLAKKYFGDADPIGREVVLENQEVWHVTAIIEDQPRNSHLPISAIVPYWRYERNVDGRNWSIYEITSYTFFLVPEDFDMTSFVEKLDPFYEKYIKEDQAKYEQEFVPVFQKMADVHYGRNDLRADFPVGDKNRLFIFGWLGIFILLISSINYLNMATARFEFRIKAVWTKKVLGATRASLFYEFLLESILTSLIAITGAIVFLKILLSTPEINSALGLAIDFSNQGLLWLLVSIFAVTGIITGMYPSLRLAAISTAGKGQGSTVTSGGKIRSVLVLFQLIISVLVINFTFLMHKQLAFLDSIDMGFQKENIISIPMRDSVAIARFEGVKNEFIKHPEIISVSSGYSRPGSVGTRLYEIEDADGEMVRQNFRTMLINFDFVETLGMEVVAGRDFDEERIVDSNDEAVLVNEQLAKTMGWLDAIGKKINVRSGVDTRVIGVLKDFNIFSLHNEIPPVIIRLARDSGGRMIIRHRGDNLPALTSYLEQQWDTINPNRPFIYDFLSDEFEAMYAEDHQQIALIKIFSIISILISCLGLLGLTSFAASKKNREVGIRKAMGASVNSILLLLSRNVTILMIAAIMISGILSVAVFEVWLENFAYKTEVPVWVFLLTGIITLMVVWITVSYHYVKVARTNPVDTLRYE